MTRPKEADARKLFRIDHPEVKSLLKLNAEEKHFSFDEIFANRAALQKEADRIHEMESDQKNEVVLTRFEKAVKRVSFAVMTYFRLKNSLQPEGTTDFASEVKLYQDSLPKALAVLKQDRAEQEKSEELAAVAQLFKNFQGLSQLAYPFLIPPTDPADRDGWTNIGTNLLQSLRTGKVHPATMAYAQMATAYANNDPEKFNKAVADYQAVLKADNPKFLTKANHESFFNHYAPFIKAMTIYLVAFLFACAFWFVWADWLRLTALRLALLALVVHSTGLIFRMYLEGRPPVTNLYSSAIFVGWGSVVLD